MIAPELGEWPCPALGGGVADELALMFGAQDRAATVLILPAWFDEANKLRRQTVEIMRHLAAANIASVLPDLPGCNESEAPLGVQTLAGWRHAASAAAAHFGATHVLTIRAGALIAPAGLPGCRYAPIGGAQVLRAMLRARIVAAKEAGRAERSDELAAQARREGITLAGWSIGPTLFGELEIATPDEEGLADIDQTGIGGPGLWLRAEPGDDPAQAAAIAAVVARGIAPA